jgi:aspartyl protease family protein
MIIFILLLWSGASAYFMWDFVFRNPQKAETISAADREQYENKIKELVAELNAAKKSQSADNDNEKEVSTEAAEMVYEELQNETEVAAGWVVITDPWSRQVTKFRAGLAGNGWLALPSRACLGGNSWRFYLDSGDESAISGGLWINGDKVGLWHLVKSSGNFDGPGLSAWNEMKAVSWKSIESAQEFNSLILPPGFTEGYFVSTSLPEYINESGVFIQEGKVVGWSFGRWLAKGYMWQGKAGKELKYNTWVKYFYNITFANGREEKFARALTLKKSNTDLFRLASFIEGFQLQPKLTAEDTPAYLLPEEIVKKIRVLVKNAIRRGEAGRVADMISSRTLKDIGDIALLLDVVTAIADARGFEAAIGEIEDSGRYIVQQQGTDTQALNKVHVRFYQDWLQSLVSASAEDEGWQAYIRARAYYPDDAYIHLLGVELALLNGDWQEAERMLYVRDYPPAFHDRYQILASSIAEMKGEEGKIVIRFPRGSSRITVNAAINGTHSQNFLVDTGATTVSIPSSMAEALGLEIQGQRTMWTASGVVAAGEVIIDSIEIGGWTEYDVKAVILDMPDQHGLGLLGINYLGRFHMNLKPEQGTLMLAPR